MNTPQTPPPVDEDAHAADAPHAPSHQTAEGFHRFAEVASVYLFALLWALTMWMMGSILYSEGYLWVLIFVLPLSWMASDVLTGLVHWMFDTYWTEETYFLGKAFVQPFREHHTLPRNICEHDLASTIGNSCILGVVVQLIVLLTLLIFDVSALGASIMIWALMSFAGAALTNVFHKWAHAEENPAWIRLLQRTGLILSPEHHDVHHASPHDTYYCITNGWMNPVLDRLRFWRALEWCLRRVGVRPDEEVQAELRQQQQQQQPG